MSSAFYYHPTCAEHAMGDGHPEQPARLAAVLNAVRSALPDLEVTTPSPAGYEALARAHSHAHVDRLFSLAPASGLRPIDADTAMNRHSLPAAQLASGAILDACEAVAQRHADNAFCCVRPPGHHAERNHAMGFCLFNGIAVAALHALDVLGMDRVAICDFDVHQGNGTEDIFRDDPRVLFCSTYQYPFYPGTNSPSVPGQRVNVPLPAGTGSVAYRDAVRATWLPELRRFRPQMILVSAGFDAHRDDPLAQLALGDEDYRWLAQTLLEVADETCDGRLVATLEGGYDLDALGRSAALFVGELHAA